MNTKSIIGKRISYFDSFSNHKTVFKITEVKYDGNGYEVRGTGSKDVIYIGMGAMKEMVENGISNQPQTIDHCPVEEIFKILG